MNIGFDAKRAFCNRSGLGNYSRNIISSLQAYYPNESYGLFTPRTNDELFHKGMINSITPSGFWQYFSSLWRYTQMGKCAREYNVNLFHGLSNELPKDIKKSGAKSVVTIHDVIFMRYPEWYKWHDREMYRQKTAFACQAADAIIAISHQTKDDLVHYFQVSPEKIHVIYQPCNFAFTDIQYTDTQQKQITQRVNLPEQYLLMVGNIEKRKNILNVIKTYQHYPIELPLLIVGRKNEYAQTLKQYTEEHQIKNIHFLHDISSFELPYIYKRASILIYPSFFEGFGLPIIEALSSRTPVITSNVSCFKETAGDGALYIDPDNMEAMSNAIQCIINDKSLRNQLVNAGYQHIQQFNHRLIAQQIMELYQSLV